jgi:sodium-independent sulfate anion transporter 11
LTIQAFGKRTDATQEMIALGMGNILGSFFGAMPITSSFGRSSVQNASGVKTPLANVYAGKCGPLTPISEI